MQAAAQSWLDHSNFAPGWTLLRLRAPPPPAGTVKAGPTSSTVGGEGGNESESKGRGKNSNEGGGRVLSGTQLTKIIEQKREEEEAAAAEERMGGIIGGSSLFSNGSGDACRGPSR